MLEKYAQIAGPEVVQHLRQLAVPLKGSNVVHINSTKAGGGVAEILHKLIPFMQNLGINASWEVIKGEDAFFQCTKGFHNAIQGHEVEIGPNFIDAYEKVNRENADRLRPVLEKADFVFIHDPQPAMLLNLIPERQGKWVWRCHIDCSRPFRPVWKYLRKLVQGYDASIFSLPQFAQRLPHPQYIIAPSIDPLSEKNMELDHEDILACREKFSIAPDKPLLLL